MQKMKLEGLGQPFSAAASVPNAVVRGLAASGVSSAVNAVASTGLTGVFSLGRGLRDFVLRGTVVELAVAVVLGTAFTNLVASATADFITPLIAAIFQGSNFQELSFELNKSSFKYGDFINAFLTFAFVVVVLYFCVVVPLEKLQVAAFKHKAIMRDCPYCLEEISMAATRCKHCTANVPLDAAMRHALALATAAMDAQEQQRAGRWYARMFAACAGRRKAVVAAAHAEEAALQQQPVADEEVGAAAGATGSSANSSQPTRLSVGLQPQRSTYASPRHSFHDSAEAGGSCSINMQQLVAVTAV